MLSEFSTWAVTPQVASNPDALSQAQLTFVDTLGCMIAGYREPQIHKMHQAINKAGAQASMSATAMINGTAIHVQDFDDYETPASTHPSAPIIGALSAMAQNQSATLGQLLEAYIVGYEAIVRMGQYLGGYTHYMDGWHATSTIGPFGATAAIAHVLGLDASRIINAMALVASSSAGLKTQFGTDTKAIHGGLAARAGLEAALMAEAGLDANPNVMDGPYGYFSRYSGGASLPSTPMRGQMDAMIRYPTLRKPWPCCAYTHRSIEAALAIHATPGFSTTSIKTGVIRMPEPFHRVVSIQRPQITAEARFSITWCVAAALVDGAVTPASFTDAALARDDIRALEQCLTVDAYDPKPGLSDLSPEAPDTVTLRYTDGSDAAQTIAMIKGGDANPMSETDICDKFAACGGNAETATQILNGDLDQPFRFAV